MPTEIEAIPELQRYFSELDRIAREAGDAKLDALEPFMRSRAPAVAESLGWTAVVKGDGEQIGVRASFGGSLRDQEEAQLASERPFRSNLYSTVSAALRGSILKGALRVMFAEPTPADSSLPQGSVIRIELATGQDAVQMVAAVLSRVHRVSFALTLQSGFELIESYETGALHTFLMDAASDTIQRTCEGEGAVKPPSDLDGAVKDLANEVFKQIPRLRERLGTPSRLESESLKASSSGDMLQLDEAFADLLESFGERGREYAGVVRNKSRARWAARSNLSRLCRLWVDPSDAKGALWVELLTDTLWLDRVRPELERQAERRSKNHEALAMPVYSEVARLHSRMGSPSNDSAQLVFEDGTAISFPLLDTSAIHLVSRGIELLGCIDAHRLLRWEAKFGYSNWLEGLPNPHIADVERGYGELAFDHLGIRDKGAPQRLRAILMAQRACAFPLPGGATGNLILLSEWKGSGRRPGRIRIELGSALMPTYVHELQGNFGGRELDRMKKLVPLVALPPFVGRERDHGAQATLSMLVTREMRVRARELFREGGVRLDLPLWAGLAEQARIPRSQVTQQLRPILDRWTQDGDDGPAFLKLMAGDRDRYTLGDAHEGARRFLFESGKLEVEASDAGKRSVRSREAKRTRVGG